MTDQRNSKYCDACDKRIVFLRGKKRDPRTGKRKMVPVDAETVEPDDREFDHARHKAHFATCTHPDRFRRKS